MRLLTAESPARVLNLPPTLIKPGRDRLPPLCDGVPGLRFPGTLRVSRKSLLKALETEKDDQRLRAVGGYPYVVCPVGPHAGHGLAMIEDRAGFLTYLAKREEESLLTPFFAQAVAGTDVLQPHPLRVAI